MSKHIVILGNGIAGATASRHLRKLNNHLRITLVSCESDFFISRTAFMYVYMGHLKIEHTEPYPRSFWVNNRIDLLKAAISEVDFSLKRLATTTGKVINYDVLILATGSTPVMLEPAEFEFIGVQCLYSLGDLQRMEINTSGIQKAVVVGGGLIGVELAEMLNSRGIQVTFLIKDNTFWGNVLPEKEGLIINRHLQQQGIELLANTLIDQFIGENGTLSHVITTCGKVIPCQFAGVAIGVTPNIEILKNSALELNKGILVDRKLKTNIPDVYAIGDCCEQRFPLPHRKAIEPVWYTGRMMGEVVAQVIVGVDVQYEPGPWFNSAKFFKIEYHTYGQIFPRPPSHIGSLYCEDLASNRALRLQYNKETGIFTGVNSLGIRLRHEFFDACLRTEVDIQYVVSHLNEARFDTEFSMDFVGSVQQLFGNQI